MLEITEGMKENGFVSHVDCCLYCDCFALTDYISSCCEESFCIHKKIQHEVNTDGKCDLFISVTRATMNKLEEKG